MKASELRIGNYLFDSVEDIGVIQVTEIKNMVDNRIGNMSICYYGVNGGYSTTSLEENSNNNEIYDYMIQPILLTKEWMLKLGFEEEKSDIPTFSKVFGRFIEDDYEHCLIINLDAYENFYTVLNGIKLILKHVHQLQNLYYALNEEELTIK
jgi:hypothetical protein